MNCRIKYLFALLCSASILSNSLWARELSEFSTPPSSYRAQVWWHWPQYVTKVGITADLESMHQAGISVAHIFVPEISPLPQGAQMLTPEWMELFRYALAEAKRLKMELGVHNCPGWSSSGGPWITPENSMKFVVFSKSRVSRGDKPLLPAQPETRQAYYREIALLAFPSPDRMSQAPEISASFPIPTPSVLLDGNRETYLKLPVRGKGGAAEIVIAYPEKRKVRFVELGFDEVQLFIRGTIEISDDGIQYRQAGTFDFHNHADQRIPKFAAIGERGEEARFFRIRFFNRERPVWCSDQDVRLNDISLTEFQMISEVESRNGNNSKFGYLPAPKGTADIAGISPADIIDLSDKVRTDGSLEWEVPEGNWIILRVGYTSTGETNHPAKLRGLECDKLSRSGLDAHWPGMMAKLLALPEAPGTLRYATIDSYEIGGQNWTDNMPQEFLRRRGYAIKPYLPVIAGHAVGNLGDSLKFLYDFQRTISDLFAENYYDYFAELCRKNQIVSTTEPYGGAFDWLRCARKADITAGEFWIGRNGDPADPKISSLPVSKLPSSSANIHGKSAAAAESFTTDELHGRWQQDPRQLKEYGDSAWVEGVNMLNMHSFVHQPYLNVKPGITLGRHGSHLNRNNTWWPLSGAYFDYVARGQYFLRGGRTVADLLVLAGESLPNAIYNHDYVRKQGYTFDFCCSDDLKEGLFTVRNGKITAPSGAEYALLHLGADRYLTVDTLKSVRTLIEAGGKVAGIRPLDSPSLADSPVEFRSEVEKIWGKLDERAATRKIGKGEIHITQSWMEPLKLLVPTPDFTAPDGIDFLHRRNNETDLFFVRNATDHGFNGKLLFRAGKGKAPHIEDFASGILASAPIAKELENGQTELILNLAPRETTGVIFTPGKFSGASDLEPVLANRNTDFTIERAFYHARHDKTFGRDVTAAVLNHYKEQEIVFPVENQLFGGDPCPGKPKVLTIACSSGEKQVTLHFPEHANVRINAAAIAAAAIDSELANAGISAPGVIASVCSGKPVLLWEVPGKVQVTGSDGKKRILEVVDVPAPLELPGPYTVKFPPDRGTPKQIILEKLQSLSAYPDDGVKYFSGIAEWSCEFSLDENLLQPNMRLFIALNKVCNIAELYINEKKVGSLWKLPWELDVTEFLHTGVNRLNVRVANLWANRIIGDARSGVEVEMNGEFPRWVLEDKPNSGNGRYTYSNWRGMGYTAADKLPESGLIGPVRIIFRKSTELQRMEK